MHTRARTFKMLASLVAAMTGTSALLGWMDPSTLPPSDRPLAAILDDARQAVHVDGITDPNRWNAIEVAAGPVMARSTALLAAAPQAGEFHFQIGLDGQMVPMLPWLEQRPFGRADGSIRVQILRADPESPMSRSQWDCVRALVTALRESPAYHDAELPVRLDRTWAAVYDLAADATIQVGPLSVVHP